MASKIAEEASNSASEGENRALRIKRKRGRRVSFADTEITSIHFFRRDDDCETPPESKPGSRGGGGGDDDVPQPENEVVGFFRDLGGDSDNSGDDEEESADGRKSFLRPAGSPSPGGSSTAGSAGSNDEDNFFGPVSSGFIRPGRFSDSGVSDDNHEETLDTTAFSLHYRSLARSESEEVKTPTAGRLVFEEKTASKDSNPASSGSIMAITEPKKLSSQSLVPLEKVRVGEDSDDMNIVDENPIRYDYGILSPSLDALLAEASNDLNAHSCDVLMGLKPPMGSEVFKSDQNGVSKMDQRNGRDSELGYTHDISAEEAVISHIKLSDTNGGSSDVAFNPLVKGNTGLTPGASDNEMQTLNRLISVHARFTEDATLEKVEARQEFPPTHSDSQLKMDGKALEFDVGEQNQYAYQHFNDNSVQESSRGEGRRDFDTDHRQGSLLEVSTLLSSSKPQQPIFSTPNSTRGSYRVSPFLKQSDLQSDKPMKHVESSARFKTSEHSFAGSSIKQGTDKLIRRLSKYSSICSPFGSAFDQNSKALQSKYLGTPVSGQNEQLFTDDLKNDEDRSLVSLDVNQLNQVETPRSTSRLSEKETVLIKDGVSLHSISVDNILKNKPSKPSTPPLSPFRLTFSGIKVMRHLSTLEDSTKDMQFPSITDSAYINHKEIDHPVMHIESGTSRTIESPGDKVNLGFQWVSPKKKLQTTETTPLSASYSPRSEESTHSLFRTVEETPSQKAAWNELMGVSSRMNSTGSPLTKLLTGSPLVQETTSRSPKKALAQTSPAEESNQNCPRKEPLHSPCRKELIWSPLDNDTNHSPSRKEQTGSLSTLDQSNATQVTCPQSTSRRDGSNNLNQKDTSNSPLSTKHVEKSSTRKRRRAAAVLEDRKHTRKSPRLQKNQDILKIGNSYSGPLSCQVNKVSNGTDKTENRTQKHWLDILEKFSRDAEQFLSPSVNMLNLEAIGTLEDILNYSSKARNYEMLGSEIQSQKAAEHSSRRQKKRITETSLLLCKIAHEKAKLQVMSAKHEKLLKRAHILKSGIQECQMLKLSVQKSKICGRDQQLEDCDLQSRSVDPDNENQVPSSTLDTMKHEIIVLDGKINSLSNLFQNYCKLKGKSSYADTLASVQDHLMTRKCCRLIRQDLQMWSVDGFECQNGGYKILLNYHGYLSQRLNLSSGSVSSIISNQLNDTKIQKIFPNMNALVAFGFVMNAEVTKRGVDIKCIGQEIQATNSLVCNLLDIVEEVQMAQIEIRNLVQAYFHSPSGQQLKLQLCFFNFHTGAKVTLTLDVTCLKRGTYPSDIVPYEVQARLIEAQKSKSLLDEITHASENLEVGYWRIKRLCRCVSQLLQASTT